MKINCLLTALLIVLSTGKIHAQNLKDVTIGFAAGPSHSFTNVYDYSLSSEAIPSLKIQKISNLSFVISSTLTVKFKKLKVDIGTKNLIKAVDDSPAKFQDRLALVVGLTF